MEKWREEELGAGTRAQKREMVEATEGGEFRVSHCLDAGIRGREDMWIVGGSPTEDTQGGEEVWVREGSFPCSESQLHFAPPGRNNP